MNNSKEINGKELYFEKVSRFFKIPSPVLFGVIIFGVWSMGDVLTKYISLKSITFLDIYNSITWWIAYSFLIVVLLSLKKKYIETIKSIDLPYVEKQKLTDSFPNKPLRIFLIVGITLNFMVLQIIFYNFVLKTPLHFVSPLNFIVWEIFLPFCGIAMGEFLSELIEISILPWRIRNKVKIDVFHPDRRGGLKRIADIFMHLILASTFVNVFFSISAFSAELTGVSTKIVSFWLLYNVGWILGVISVFVIPQIFLSRVMKATKYRELDKYHRNFVPCETSIDFQESLIRLYNIELYREIQKMHEYPFDMKQLEKVIGIAIIPVIQKLLPFMLVYFK